MNSNSTKNLHALNTSTDYREVQIKIKNYFLNN